jgi:hypothetical protein
MENYPYKSTYITTDEVWADYIKCNTCNTVYLYIDDEDFYYIPVYKFCPHCGISFFPKDGV